MVKKIKQLLIIIPSFLFVAILLMAIMQDASYAKGVTKSDRSAPSLWGSTSSSSHNSSISTKSRIGTGGWNSTRPSSTGISHSYRPSSSWSGTPFNSSISRPYSSRSSVLFGSSSSSSLKKDNGWSTLSTKERWEARNSTSLSQRESTRYESNRPSTSSSYRKDYSSIGKIWISRSEKRDTTPDREKKYESTKIRIEDHRYPYIVFHSTSRLYYPYYCYEYKRDYCWPSVYFYYGTIPPYIFGPQIVVVPTFANRRICVQIPIIINWKDDYYLYDRYGCRLREALTRIERAWERNDEYLIRSHLRFGSRIAIYLRGTYAYSISADDFFDMTRDAMRNIRTRSFEFDRIDRRSHDRVVACGTHLYVDKDNGLVKSVYVCYTFERYGSDWYITEVGCWPNYPW